jgi:hypothetical protein
VRCPSGRRGSFLSLSSADIILLFVLVVGWSSIFLVPPFCATIAVPPLHTAIVVLTSRRSLPDQTEYYETKECDVPTTTDTIQLFDETKDYDRMTNDDRYTRRYNLIVRRVLRRVV